MKTQAKVIGVLILMVFIGTLLIVPNVSAAAKYYFKGTVSYNGVPLRNKNVTVKVEVEFCCCSEVDQGCWPVSGKDTRTDSKGEYFIEIEQNQDPRTYTVIATYNGKSSKMIYVGSVGSMNKKDINIKKSTPGPPPPPPSCPPGTRQCEPGICRPHGVPCP